MYGFSVLNLYIFAANAPGSIASMGCVATLPHPLVVGC
jgi:hypothetical protein